MMVDDIIHNVSPTPYSFPVASWLAGAAAGLQVLKPRTPKWMWADFISDIYEMISLLGSVEPAEPGTSPEYGDTIGSAYDALGGYCSIASELTPEGLFFRVPVARQEQVLELLRGLTLFSSHGEILVPLDNLPAFTRLVPLEGPVAEQIMLEVAL
ncbi:MAG: hypothetical protein ACTSRQ_06550 [Candidatus Thorarchaeota archaeon]